MQTKRRKSKSGRAGRRGQRLNFTGRGGFSARSELSDGPSYAGQQCVKFRLPGTPQLLSTTVTTGVIANSYAIDANNITGFSARFGSTFDEYRILGVDSIIRPVAASTGVSVHFYDEKLSSAPTANEAQERVGARLPNTNANAKSVKSMRWRARDLLDLQYIAVTTTGTNSVWFKTYTDAATFGAPAVVTPLWLIEPTFIVEFRGIKST